MNSKTLARESVRRHVWSGFYNYDDIVEIIDGDVFDSGEIDRTWLCKEIRKEMSRKQAEETKWPPQTDCDRLDQVFLALNSGGVLALQNAGYTQSDGMNDVIRRFKEAGGGESSIKGYCFYHGQDLERIMDQGELRLAFGAVTGAEADGVLIGQQIRQAFEASGFTVEWDGTMRARPLIKGFKWQRRAPAEPDFTGEAKV